MIDTGTGIGKGEFKVFIEKSHRSCQILEYILCVDGANEAAKSDVKVAGIDPVPSFLEPL